VGNHHALASVIFSNRSACSTFFSTLDETLPSSVILEDPQAVDLNIKCGVVPHSNLRNESITGEFDPACKASYEKSHNKLELAEPAPQHHPLQSTTSPSSWPSISTYQAGAYSISQPIFIIQSGGDGIQFGGGKAGMDSPPVIRCTSSAEISAEFDAV
jgi:hypothetical protein